MACWIKSHERKVPDSTGRHNTISFPPFFVLAVQFSIQSLLLKLCNYLEVIKHINHDKASKKMKTKIFFSITKKNKIKIVDLSEPMVKFKSDIAGLLLHCLPNWRISASFPPV
ncbi:hypothetical protein HanXRQr2_Chr10g0451151 [Helianthus annuus]|uniref:Uncharacterized protein n=1 Tax=Helianthus annuus TaxID=4232 RepID=A0A9K3N4U0_HELAN|nr:hypothetical protein HanXRQr2_Chr10g0451151 [Helianthus annuus]